jgi:hypothetical protein
MFMTSWCLTLFAHDTHSLECTRRIYDLILAEHPLIIVYLCVSLIIERQDELYDQAEEYDQITAAFIVFKSPLAILSESTVLERVVHRAL